MWNPLKKKKEEPVKHDHPWAKLPHKGRGVQDFTYNNGNQLTEYEKEYFYEAICPDCLEAKLVNGPSGGGCQNIYCNNTICGSKFNEMGPFGVQRISDRQPVKQKQVHTKVIEEIKVEPTSDEPDEGFILRGNL